MRTQNYRVESICRVLTEQGVQVAPRTYRNWKTAPPSARTIDDAHLTDALRATVGEPEGLYGRRKMVRYLRRTGHNAAACTVDRLMTDEGLSGIVRGRRHRTTIPGGKDSRRAPDLLNRDFTSEAPNRKWSPTSPIPGRGLASCTWRSSSTASPVRSWGGTRRR